MNWARLLCGFLGVLIGIADLIVLHDVGHALMLCGLGAMTCDYSMGALQREGVIA